MKLIPKQPPGRPNRKALAFEGEIARLRSEGYTCEAIWEALVEAGLAVSRSSVKREALRLTKRRATTSTRGLAMPSQAHASAVRTAASSPATIDLSLPGQEVAAVWMDGQVTNPLFRARSSP